MRRLILATRDGKLDPTLAIAQRLARALWEKHWKDDAPDWKPLNTTLDVLMQIDNMTTGLVRKC